jgi:hypothetical protein
MDTRIDLFTRMKIKRNLDIISIPQVIYRCREVKCGNWTHHAYYSAKVYFFMTVISAKRRVVASGTATSTLLSAWTLPLQSVFLPSHSCTKSRSIPAYLHMGDHYKPFTGHVDSHLTEHCLPAYENGRHRTIMKGNSVWEVYNDEARKVDSELVKDWTASLNFLLVFVSSVG